MSIALPCALGAPAEPVGVTYPSTQHPFGLMDRKPAPGYDWACCITCDNMRPSNPRMCREATWSPAIFRMKRWAAWALANLGYLPIFDRNRFQVDDISNHTFDELSQNAFVDYYFIGFAYAADAFLFKLRWSLTEIDAD